MRTRLVMLAASVSFALILAPVSPDGLWAGPVDNGALDAPKAWKPALVEGLRVGEATREEVLAQFGSPDRIESYSAEQTGGHPIEWLIYDRTIVPRFPGYATVWIDGQTGRLTTVTITPRELSRGRLLEELGADFQMMRYNFCEELGDGDSAPIYEDPSGGLEYMEFRELGISVQFDWRGDVQQMTFLSKPSAISKEKCLAAAREGE